MNATETLMSEATSAAGRAVAKASLAIEQGDPTRALQWADVAARLMAGVAALRSPEFPVLPPLAMKSRYSP